MGDNDLIPISDEQAKLARAIVEAGKDSFGYLADILGELPKDLVGLLVGDRVKVARAERLARLYEDAKKRLADRGVAEPEPPPLKLALPILAAAADETRDELRDLWAKLLASAMDPDRQGSLRQSFIEIVKEMDPFDALVFRAIVDHGSSPWHQSAIIAISQQLCGEQEEVHVSIDNLKRMNLIFASAGSAYTSPLLLPLGKVLAWALAD